MISALPDMDRLAFLTDCEIPAWTRMSDTLDRLFARFEAYGVDLVTLGEARLDAEFEIKTALACCTMKGRFADV